MDLLDLAGELLAERSQSSGVQQGRQLILAYRHLADSKKTAFLLALARGFAPDAATIRRALDAYDAAPSARALSRVSNAAEAPRQELLRRLNQAPMATAALVEMRADLLARLSANPDLRTLDDDFVHLLRSWFNRGFLVMRRIDWSSPADLLERVIRYEAVHSIATWDELRDRLLPPDRRCYGFFHPALGEEPLIFVEVALTATVPESIGALLEPERGILEAKYAQAAVFYSISNCQPGLAGISFGQFLIKQVVDDLAGELPWLKTFVTLSPIPGFLKWLGQSAQAGDGDARLSLADGVPDLSWSRDDPRTRSRLALAARYFLTERDSRGGLIDPVARFHVGNGARVDRLCWVGDTSSRGMAQSGGLMVNYVYDLPTLQANRDGYARNRTVAAGPAVTAMLDPKDAVMRATG
ncbi:malonyl-CoA decarboxylase [Sphingomonas sp. UYEF23]|uniref:malonyl-CoA decarboxylase n=1 Tax=Sphingomonas sp. UYEF23 TaxID=1756408 RepID=UPI003390C590